MADTARKKSELQALFPDNTTAQISAQDLRDFLASAQLNTITEVTDPAYEIVDDDVIIHVAYTNTGICAITWPTELMTNNRIIDFKDADGNASVNNITITPESGLIEGAASFPISIDSAAYTIYCWDGDLYIK
jgi:hypothetical protein